MGANDPAENASLNAAYSEATDTSIRLAAENAELRVENRNLLVAGKPNRKANRRYDSVVRDRDAARAEIARLEAENAELRNQVEFFEELGLSLLLTHVRLKLEAERDALAAENAELHKQGQRWAAKVWDEGWEARDADEYGGSLTVAGRRNPYRVEGGENQ